ncbi:MAG: hypothetical protein ACTS27_11310 [Phycisphaerales bacterium]
MHKPFLAFAAGLAAASPLALAHTPETAGALAGTRVQRVPLDPAAFLRDGNFNGAFVTMRDELENFPTDTSFGGTGVSAPATSFTGPPGFVWPLNNLRGQSGGSEMLPLVRVVDLSTAPVGGPNGIFNASKVVRIQTVAAQPAGGFFTGYNLRFGGDSAGADPLQPLAPTADHNARVSAEHFISTIDQLFTFEPVATFTGFITGRLMWGGVCEEIEPGDCTDIGIPIGLNDQFLALGPCLGFCPGGLFVPLFYCHNAQGQPIPACIPPAGSNIGDPARPPVQNWFRIAAETTADNRLRFLVDLLDGQPEFTIYDNVLLTTPYIDRIGSNTSFESLDAFMLVDNIEASGPLLSLPKPPPLDCPYLDDVEWLSDGPLFNQNPRWFAALSSAATVITDGDRGQVIRQVNNINPDNRHRREFATSLPDTPITVANDVIARVKVRTSNQHTVRAFALWNFGDLAARVYLGRQTADTFYEPSVYAQINPDYNPIDPPNDDPFLNTSVVGVDVADTNADWMNDGQYRTLELRLSANGVLRVSIDGQRIYAGPGAFSNAVDLLAFESENNTFGKGQDMRIDDVEFVCDAPPCAADFNLDDVVDFADLNTVLTNYGALFIVPPQYFLGNANNDDAVDFADLNAVLTSFGMTCN